MSLPSAPPPVDADVAAGVVFAGLNPPADSWPMAPATVDQLNEQAARCCADDPRVARDLAREAQALALRLDYQPGLAWALLRQARSEHFLQDEGEAALTLAQRAQALFESLEDPAGQAEAINLLANVHASRHEGELALTQYHRGLALRRQRGDRVGEAGLLNNIGRVLRERWASSPMPCSTC